MISVPIKQYVLIGLQLFLIVFFIVFILSPFSLLRPDRLVSRDVSPRHPSATTVLRPPDPFILEWSRSSGFVHRGTNRGSKDVDSLVPLKDSREFLRLKR